MPAAYEYNVMRRGDLKSSLIRGTIQLAAAGILVRIIGLANRMALARLVGDEGLGLFAMILPLYALLAVITGLGLSGAVTKMVADRSACGDISGRRRVRLFALRFVLASAAAVSVLLWLATAFPLQFIPDRRIIGFLRLMPAAVIFSAVSSILRSDSQGQGKMAPTALSQVAEQVVRVGLGLAAASWLAPRGMEKAITGFFGGIIAGEIACLTVLCLVQPAGERRALLLSSSRRPPPLMLKELFSLSLPILLIRLSTSITQTAESLLIPARLQSAGFAVNESTALFGRLAGMALPLLFLPTVLIIPLTTTLVPAIAGAVTLRRRSRLESLVNLSLWGTLAVGSLSAALLYLAAEPLTAALYGSTVSAGLVAKLAPIAPFAYLQFTTAAILHGMGRPAYAVAADLAGTAVSLSIIYYLTALPHWGINGVTCAYTFSFIIIALLEYFMICRFMSKI